MGQHGEMCFCGENHRDICEGCEWERMASAPKDGTWVDLLIRHQNYQYATGDKERAQWEQVCPGQWIDHNGGGWTWLGLCGRVDGWRPLTANA